MPRPPSDGNAQSRWSAASRRGTKSAGHSLLMPRPEVTAHPATAMRKAGGPRRPDAEQSCARQVAHPATAIRRWSAASRRGTKLAGHSLLMPRPEVTAHPATAMHKAGGPRRPDAEQSGRSLVAHAAPGGHGPPSDGNAQGRWSAASRRGTKLAGHSLLMPRPEVTAHPATAMRKAGGPRRPDAELSRQVTRCSCRARRSPSDGNAQGRWSAASRRGTKSGRCSCRTRRSRPTQRRQCARQVVRGVPTRNKAAGHSLLMPHPEVTAHPATAMRKAGGPRRPDAELRQIVAHGRCTRCSCRRTRRSPTQRRQSARQVVRGVPTRNKAAGHVAHAAPGGHGPPSDGKGRWSAASRRGTKLAGHSLLMPHPEVTAHPSAHRPRRPECRSRQVVRGVPTRNKDAQEGTRCSCRARRSRPTQRRQCARQVVRGVPTRN